MANVVIQSLGQNNMCLDVPPNQHEPIYPLQLKPCTQETEQHWISFDHQLIANNRMCLETKGGSIKEGTPIGLSPCSHQNHQLWMTHADG